MRESWRHRLLSLQGLNKASYRHILGLTSLWKHSIPVSPGFDLPSEPFPALPVFAIWRVLDWETVLFSNFETFRLENFSLCILIEIQIASLELSFSLLYYQQLKKPIDTFNILPGNQSQIYHSLGFFFLFLSMFSVNAGYTTGKSPFTIRHSVSMLQYPLSIFVLVFLSTAECPYCSWYLCLSSSPF